MSSEVTRISVSEGPIAPKKGEEGRADAFPLVKEMSDHYSLAHVDETVDINEAEVRPKFIRNPSVIIGARKIGRSSMLTVPGETPEQRVTRLQIEWQIGIRDSMDSMEDLTLMKSPEFDAAYSNLMTWTAVNNLDLSSASSAVVKYPEYITAGNYVAKTDSTKPLTVNFRIPSTGNEVNSAGVSTMFALKSTVADMIKYVQGKFQYLGIELDETKLDNYFPKIVGEKEYLLHRKIPIGMYDSVTRAGRLGEPLNVVIVQITDSEKEQLHQIINQTERQYIEQYLSVRGMKNSQNSESIAMKNLKLLLQSDEEPAGNIFTSESEEIATKVGTICLEDDVDAFPVNNPEIIKREDCDADLYIRVEGISFTEPLNYISFESFFVEMCLYCYDEKLCEPFITQTVSLDGEADGVRYLKVPTGAINLLLNISLIPPATRVTFALIGNMDKKKGYFQATSTEKIPVAGAAIPLIDFKGMLSHTTKTIGLFPLNDGYGEKSWRFKNAIVETKRAQVERISSTEKGGSGSKEASANYGGNFKIDLDKEDPQYQFLRIQSLSTAVLGSNLFSDIVLNITFNSPIGKTIVCTKVFKDQVLRNKDEYMLKEGRNMMSPIASMQPSVEEVAKLKNIEFSSTLHPLTPEDKRLLWEFRHFCVNIPQLLPKFLRAVQWKVKAKVDEARILLYSWKTLRPSDALELLDIRFSDNIVREYAIEKLNELNDAALSELLLQLTQVLKYEVYHDSALLRFLLKRAILSPLIIGQPLYWMLRSEMYVPAYQERLGLLLNVYLIRCGVYRDALYRQLVVNESIRQIAEDLKLQPSKNRENYAKQHLEALNASLPGSYSLCLNPRIELKSIKFAKCKVMTSKKLPLWLVFQNSDDNGDDYYSIYKAGDDLRQDQLTLQLIRIMDSLWRDGHGEMPEGCDVHFPASSEKSIHSESRHNVHQLLVRAQHKRKDVKLPGKVRAPTATSSIFNAFSNLTGLFKPKVAPPTEAASQDTREMHDNPLAARNVLLRAPPSARNISDRSVGSTSANSSGSSVHHNRRTSSTQIIGEEVVEGLDLRMKPYRCVSTGYQTGMIEIVMNSQTLANIQTEYGGVISGAFSTTTIKDYLKTYNPGTKYKDSADNFSRTCAGYCVATYVLGIGDRHADNIMVSKHGHIFHIDFGHFLGNFKSKFGINRERSPFVFTPEMAAVLTNKEHGNDGAVDDDVDMYLDFEEQCCRAFNILRRRNSLLLNLFTLMLPAGMPDLLERSDVQYSVDMLSLDLTEDEANEKFIDELDKSLSNISRRLDNLFHNVKHKR